MAASIEKGFVVFTILTVLSAQVSCMPLGLRLLLQPLLLDFRIRGASFLNEAGIGYGGILTSIGQSIHGVMAGIGESINEKLNGIAKFFSSNDEVHDDQTELHFQLENLKKNGDYHQGFVGKSQAAIQKEKKDDEKEKKYGWVKKIFGLSLM